MCGRYTREYTWRQVHDFLDLKFPSIAELPPSYNVAPSQFEPVCRLDGAGQRELALMRWGFRPAWAADGGPAPINARVETAATSRMFRTAFAERRCLVPASGFYEWERSGKSTQPFYIHVRGTDVFCFAGLWESSAAEGEPATFTILTTESNELVRPIHGRMPVILEPSDHGEWLAGKIPAAKLASPFPAARMAAHPVSKRVGNPKLNTPDLVRPASSEGLFG